MKRHKARETAFQVIFQLDINDRDPHQAIEQFLGTNEIDPFLQALVKGVNTYCEEIDLKIANHLENWSIDRIARVEKTILRIAVYEIFYLDDIPQLVSINEAVELGKIFGDEQSGKFINGVLKKIVT